MNRHPFGYIEVLSFLLFVSLGYWIGKGVAAQRLAPIELKAIIPAPSPLPSLPDGERILLLVNVDQVNSQQPELVSLWLLTYYLDNQPVQLLPIYPGDHSTTGLFESELRRTFSISRVGATAQLDPIFLRFLADYNYWLSGYLILDTFATAQIIDLLGGLPNGHDQSNGADIIRTMPDSVEHPQNALRQQTRLFGQACLTLSQLTQQPDWSRIMELIPEHIITDPQPQDLLSELNLILSIPSLVRCEFPVQLSAP